MAQFDIVDEADLRSFLSEEAPIWVPSAAVISPWCIVLGAVIPLVIPDADMLISCIIMVIGAFGQMMFSIRTYILSERSRRSMTVLYSLYLCVSHPEIFEPDDP